MKSKKLICGIIAILIGLALGLTLLMQGNDTADKIYSNVYIHSVAVGGLSASEANAALMERYQPLFESNTVQYMFENEIIASYNFFNFGASLDFSNQVEAALEYSSTSVIQSIGRIFGRSFNIDDAPNVIMTSKADSIFAELSRKVGIDAQNASFYKEDGNIVITPEIAGRTVDMSALVTATHDVIHSFTGGVINIATQTVKPTYTTLDFDFVISELGAFQTLYSGMENDARIYNLRLASERVHNQVIFPEEIFSAGAIIAANKPNSGYKSAIVLVNGEPVEDVGGGVCQVVSTLYNAVIRAELTVIQRHSHSAIVSYVDAGFDATVAGDYYDLKFRNNTSHPILISCIMAHGMLDVRIYGFEQRSPERSIRFTTTKEEVILTEPFREIVDATIPRGERRIILNPQSGYNVILYKHVYMQGRAVETIKINSSSYKALQGVVAIGAG